MVLQREQPLPIWGWADPGERVTVTLGEESKSTTADERGQWRVTLAPRSAVAEKNALVLRIKGTNNTIQLTDILVGDVWVCSGQSNMEWAVAGAMNAKDEIAAADFPNIRTFEIPRRPAGEPQDDVPDVAWHRCTPGAIGGFSAVGYFFGRHLHQELDVPIGLIQAAWGGTRIEPWTPKEGFTLVENEELQAIGQKQVELEANYRHATQQAIDVIDKWIDAARTASQRGRPIPPMPNALPGAGAGNVSHLYNGMVAPIVPLAIKGATWYQGESNVGQGMRYRDHMEALIEGWRKAWNQPTNRDFPFYFVQLAPFTYNGPPTRLPDMWQAQFATVRTVPNTGVALTQDISNVKDIHPRNKQDVGKRLALLALAKTYNRDNLVYTGPTFKSVKADGNTLQLTFDHMAAGLSSRDTKPLTWFEIAGPDGQFVHAKAQIGPLGQTLTVWSELIDQPTAVRFAWHQTAEPNLVNSEGLPAAPFTATVSAKQP